MSDKFGEGRDPYLYPGLDIMRNRLNIRQQQRLEQAAYEMTALRAATIELGPLVRGLPHLRTLHRQLYQDIFDWAGQLREVDIYQGDTPFCHFAYIEKEGNALMQDLEEEGYLVGLEKAKFVIAEPKNIGVNSPARTLSKSNGSPATSSNSISSSNAWYTSSPNSSFMCGSVKAPFSDASFS